MDIVFRIIGVSHKTSSIEERVEFDCVCQDFIEDIKRGPFKSLEIVHLSTCNRSEIYIGSKNAELQIDLNNIIELQFSGFPSYYDLQGELAINHIYRLLAGLDSLAIGETQIVSQIKRAYENARLEGRASLVINKIFQEGFRVAKKIRTITGVGRGSLSIASLAVSQAEHVFGTLSERKALVVGVGETGTLVSKYLVSKNIGSLFLSNRTFEKALNLSNELGGVAVPLENVSTVLKMVDILVVAVETNNILDMFNSNYFKDRLRGATDLSPFCILDLSVPKQVNSEVLKYSEVFSYCVDDLSEMVEENLLLKEKEIQQADIIIKKEMSALISWFKTRGAATSIADLKESLINNAEVRAISRLDEVDYTSFIGRFMHRLFVGLRKFETQRNESINQDELKAKLIKELSFNAN